MVGFLELELTVEIVDEQVVSFIELGHHGG